MLFQLMRYHFERQNKLMLDLFDFRTNQNIEVYISMKYWQVNNFTIKLIGDSLHRESIKNIEHTLDEWYRLVKECVNYANNPTKSNK